MLNEIYGEAQIVALYSSSKMTLQVERVELYLLKL